MRETPGLQFQKERYLKLWLSNHGKLLCEPNLLTGRFTSTNSAFLSVSSLLKSLTQLSDTMFHSLIVTVPISMYRSKMRTDDWSFLADLRVSITDSSAVLVEWPLLKPDCFGSITFFLNMSETWVKAPHSCILDRKGSSKTCL